MTESPPDPTSDEAAFGDEPSDGDGEHTKPLSQILVELVDGPDHTVTIGEIVEAFGRRAMGALLFIFATPNLLPLPPGSSTILGAPLVLIAPQMALGVRQVWLPGKTAARRISAATLHRTFARIEPWLTRIEHVSKPRLGFLFGPIGDRVLGVVCSTLALVLILPVPLGNLLPAAAIATLSLSLVLRDGLLAILGYALAAASWTVLVMGGAVIVAFALHLADAWPEAGLAPPPGASERADYYRWMAVISNTLQAEMRAWFYPHEFTTDPDGAEAVKAAVGARLDGAFERIAAQLGDGPWLLGERFSAADLYLLMMVRWGRTLPRPAREIPALGLHADRVLARPAVQATFVAEGLQAPFV